MGNKTIQGLSSVITKNWLPLYEGADVYQNKLTSQTIREQFMKIENTNNFQELKFRMKQKNPYICRVVFYSHYIHNLYYVYTEENRNKPVVRNFREWEIHQKNIIESFIQLAGKYGPTRVCREMIGVDNSGQIKIWINPNTVKSERWLPCDSFQQMVEDIKSVLDQIARDSSPMKTVKMKNVQGIKINQDQNNCIKKGYNKNLGLKNLSQLKIPTISEESKSQKRLQFLRPSFAKCNRKGLRGKTNLKKSDNNTSTSEHQKEKQKRELSKYKKNMYLDVQRSSSNSHFFCQSDGLNRARTQFFPQFKSQSKQVYTCKTQKVKNPGHYRTHSLAQNKIGMGHQEKVSSKNLGRQNKIEERQQIWGSQRLDKNRIFTDFQFKRKSFEGDQKILSKKLEDVKHIIVIEQGESYFNSRERKRDRCILNQKQNEENILSRNQMTLSQQFFVFFHDNDSSQIHRVRKTSRLFQNLLQEVNDLLD